MFGCHRRHLTDRTGRWHRPSADGIELFNIATVPRYRYRGSKIPNPWVANHAYTAGTLVTYAGHTYKCLQSHTSLVGWEPPNVPALWQLVS